MTDSSDGLIQKFNVERRHPSSRGIDHSGCRYFVLDPQHDPIAYTVLGTYMTLAGWRGDEALAQDIKEWLDSIETTEEKK